MPLSPHCYWAKVEHDFVSLTVGQHVRIATTPPTDGTATASAAMELGVRAAVVRVVALVLF